MLLYGLIDHPVAEKSEIEYNNRCYHEEESYEEEIEYCFSNSDDLKNLISPLKLPSIQNFEYHGHF